MEQTKNAYKDLFIARARAGAGVVLFIFSQLNRLNNALPLISSALIFGFACMMGWGVGLSRAEPAQSYSVNQLTSADLIERIEALESVRSGNANFSSEDVRAQRLVEQNPLVRHRLNQALSDMEGRSAVDVLVESLQSDQSALVRAGAAALLGGYVRLPAVEAALIVTARSDTTSEVRYAAVRSLSISRSDEAFAVIAEAATDDDPSMRRQAAASLSRSKRGGAQKVLNKMKRDKDESVRRAAGAK